MSRFTENTRVTGSGAVHNPIRRITYMHDIDLHDIDIDLTELT